MAENPHHPLYRWTPEMRKEVDRLLKAGTSFAELGKMYNVSGSRIRQVHEQTQRRLWRHLNNEEFLAVLAERDAKYEKQQADRRRKYLMMTGQIPDKTICPVCHKLMRIRVDGTLTKHGHKYNTQEKAGHKQGRCLGSGKHPEAAKSVCTLA